MLTLDYLIGIHKEEAASLMKQVEANIHDTPKFLDLLAKKRIAEGKAANFKFKKLNIMAGNPPNGVIEGVEITINQSAQ